MKHRAGFTTHRPAMPWTPQVCRCWQPKKKESLASQVCPFMYKDDSHPAVLCCTVSYSAENGEMASKRHVKMDVRGNWTAYHHRHGQCIVYLMPRCIARQRPAKSISLRSLWPPQGKLPEGLHPAGASHSIDACQPRRTLVAGKFTQPPRRHMWRMGEPPRVRK